MALTLSTTGIVDGQLITAAQISQSIDALTGAEAYDITISGSLKLTGSVSSQNGFTGSLLGTASVAISSSVAVTSSRALSALNADTVDIDNIPTTNVGFLVTFVAKDSSYPASRAINIDSGSDGSGLWYNPSNNSLTASYFEGTASFAVSASIATSASYASNASNVTYTYIGIDDITYSSSAAPYPVQNTTPNQIYVSQSAPPFQLALQFGTGNNGQIINFTPYYEATSLILSNIEITSSVFIYGSNGNKINPSVPATANNLFTGVGNVNNLTFQYISTPSGFLTSGWYLINVNQN
jgi:hypothetical protein